MSQKLLIRDLTLRDGQQSQFATRMTQSQVDRVLPLYKDARFYAMEVWGGAVPDSVMRYLNESPWTRLERIKQAVGDSSKLTALSRGRNLFGYTPYPDEVIEGFCRHAVGSGIDIMRIFDALNDIDNMTSSIRFVKENGGLADCAVCYTVDPQVSLPARALALLRGRPVPRRVFGIPYFVEKALRLQELGADMITIKDMAGLITPQVTARLIPALKAKLTIPVNLHTHCTPGFGLASVLVAMACGVDVVDTVIMNFAGGPAAPAFELVQIFAAKLGLETGVGLEAVAAINRELKAIRRELGDFDEYKHYLPREFAIGRDALPPDVDSLFDGSVEAVRRGRIDEALELCQRIERFFNFPPPDEAVRKAQIPGGMYTNMMAQMKQAKLEHLFDQVLATVPRVRLDSGLPPLVTPTSQIVGVQAVNCVVDDSKGKPFYTTTSTNFVNLVKGSYGHTPIAIDPEFRLRIAGVREETPYDTSRYQRQPNPVLPLCGHARLARDEKEELLLELFPNVADKFLQEVRAREWAARSAEQPAPPPARDPRDDMWEALSEYA